MTEATKLTGNPNIIFILSDQQRWDTMGCYGQKLDVTPNLDKLAAEGVRFNNAFSCQPVCGPARACLQTGRYATEHGVWRNGVRLPSGRPCLADQLSRADYQTAYVGKWHLASNISHIDPEDRPDEDYEQAPVPIKRRGGYKDFWVAADLLEHTSDSQSGRMWDTEGHPMDFKGYRVDWTTDCAIDFLRQRQDTRPFFLFLSYLEPHHQNHRHRYEGPEGSWDMFNGYEAPPDLVNQGGDWRQNFPDYLGCCHAIDRNVARLRQELERQKVWDHTLLIYTSDHGSHFRTRNQEYKRSCHDASIHIPLILRGPGFSGGRVVDEIASLIDLPSTVIESAGAEPLPGQRGRPLQALMQEAPPDDWPEEAFVQISEDGVGRAIRTAHHTYAIHAPDVWRHSSSPRYIESFLYDNREDPGQLTNRLEHPHYQELRVRLRQRLLNRMAEIGEPLPELAEPSRA